MEWILDDKEAKLRAASNLAAQDEVTRRKLRKKRSKEQISTEKNAQSTLDGSE